jgi:deoxyribodipyrimidine photolyase-like uncharacterized protein
MDHSEPVTGRWNYDADNREAPPRGVTQLDVTPSWEPEEDEIDNEVRRDLDEWERKGVIETLGRDGPRRFAATREEAVTALGHFVEHRLPGFGPHEDANAVEARCLASVLAQVRDHAWVHHIPRLMVLANYGLQRGWSPRALTDWFHRCFIDGYDWVMLPNVLGMSQHAGGGLMAHQAVRRRRGVHQPDERLLR